jgi:PfpI family intracellular protease
MNSGKLTPINAPSTGDLHFPVGAAAERSRRNAADVTLETSTRAKKPRRRARAGDTLKGLKIAILVTDGFELVELTEPRRALDEAGATTRIVSPKSATVRSWNFTDWDCELPVDVKLDEARPEDFDGLHLPGGVINPDSLRIQPKAMTFVKAFFDAGKPVASICHGPWSIIEVGAARGRRMTSWPSLRTDLRNAGADWVDQEVIVDKGVVTSRKPDDIPAYNREMIRMFGGAKARNAAA